MTIDLATTLSYYFRKKKLCPVQGLLFLFLIKVLEVLLFVVWRTWIVVDSIEMMRGCLKLLDHTGIHASSLGLALHGPPRESTTGTLNGLLHGPRGGNG
jgi:hypothetical protein